MSQPSHLYARCATRLQWVYGSYNFAFALPQRRTHLFRHQRPRFLHITMLHITHACPVEPRPTNPTPTNAVNIISVTTSTAPAAAQQLRPCLLLLLLSFFFLFFSIVWREFCVDCEGGFYYATMTELAVTPLAIPLGFIVHLLHPRWGLLNCCHFTYCSQ